MPSYKLISARDSDRPQCVVHYAHPQYRRNFRPLCGTVSWERLTWEIDPADGLGADICGRCIRSAETREKERLKKQAKRRLRAYYNNHDANKAKHSFTMAEGQSPCDQHQAQGQVLGKEAKCGFLECATAT